MFGEFKVFLKHYGIVGLAIAVIIGGKLNDLVSSLVNDLITPIILQPMLHAANVDDIRKLSFEGIHYGRVLGATIEFVTVAFLIFVFAKYILKDEEVALKK